MSNTPFPANFHKGKPKLPDNLPKLPRIPKLKDFIGPQSHLLFHLLRVGSNWLRTPVGKWAEDLEYQRVGEFLKHLAVVNDTAEQCIKDITEYAYITKDGLYMEDLLLCVNDYRYVFQDLRKEAMNRVNYW